jgi:hypothetical protein
MDLAKNSGALDDARQQGHLDTPLSTVPELELLSATAAIARSKVGAQATQLNSADGFQVGTIGNDLTNPMLLRDRYNGAITLSLQEQESVAMEMAGNLEQSRSYWISKIQENQPIENEEFIHHLRSLPVEQLRSFYEMTQGEDEEKGQSKGKPGMYTGQAGEYPRGKDTRSQTGFSAEQWVGKDGAGQSASSKGKDDEQTSKNTSTEDELRPFLPTIGSKLLEQTRDERELAGLNLALFDNIPRDLGTGDVRINPLQFDLAMEQGRRFNGDNKILDPVFPGGSLNIGALPVTTERLMLPPEELDAYHTCFISKKNKRMRMTAKDDYRQMKNDCAANALKAQMNDVRWVFNNRGSTDVFHSSSAFNTMPVPVDEWVNKKQIDGDVPLQPDLLPAQGLSIAGQLGGGPLPYTQFNSLSAKKDPTYNPSFRYGWNYATPFQ